jgi:hypothetical protein
MLRSHCVFRRFVWRRFVKEMFCMCAIFYGSDLIFDVTKMFRILEVRVPPSVPQHRMKLFAKFQFQ